MSKPYIHVKELEVPLYRGKLVIILTNDRDLLLKKVPTFSSNALYAHRYVADWKGFVGYIIILNFHNKFRGITNGTIAHEALHAAGAILHERGVDASFVNDEPITYLVDWITDEIHKEVNRRGFKVSLNG